MSGATTSDTNFAASPALADERPAQLADLAMSVPPVGMKPRNIIAIDGLFNDSDMLRTSLGLQCRDAGIRFTCL